MSAIKHAWPLLAVFIIGAFTGCSVQQLKPADTELVILDPAPEPEHVYMVCVSYSIPSSDLPEGLHYLLAECDTYYALEDIPL